MNNDTEAWMAHDTKRARAALAQARGRRTCDKAPAGWLCLGDLGHDGPCAAAPLRGMGRCPDIERCVERGCQCKCGPSLSARVRWWLRRIFG